MWGWLLVGIGLGFLIAALFVGVVVLMAPGDKWVATDLDEADRKHRGKGAGL